ncbi:MAG: hypothetical protein ACE5JL_16935 [Dehalococcoidia bacterium]
MGQGRENVKDFLRQSPDIAGKIEEEIRSAVELTATPAVVEAIPEPEPPN